MTLAAKEIVRRTGGILHCRSLTLFLTETPMSQSQRLDLAIMSETFEPFFVFLVREKARRQLSTRSRV